MQLPVKPMVTIAMVTYNSSNYLREAIESVLSSTYKNIELLISDDCSTDDTWKIIESYKDDRIRAIKHQKNLGEYNNRNFCLKEAKGKYLIYIDGDDKISSKGVDVFVKELEGNGECGMAISRTKPNEVNKILTPKEAYMLHYLGKTMLNLALVRVCFNTKKFKKLGGFSNQYKSGDDYARLLIAANYHTIIVEDNLVWWRKSPNSASERLFNSYSGVYEPFAIKYYFLNTTNLLNEEAQKQAHQKLKRSYYNTLKSLLKRGEIKWFVQMIFDFSQIRKVGKNS